MQIKDTIFLMNNRNTVEQYSIGQPISSTGPLILVTGGAGFIGSHCLVELLGLRNFPRKIPASLEPESPQKDFIENNYQVIVVDNFINSNRTSLDRVIEITGKGLLYYPVDMTNKSKLREVFKVHGERITNVIHLAGLKAVGESIKSPLYYYRNNIDSTLNLLELMDEYQVHNLVFSSSATVYGLPDLVPICEEAAIRPTNPYGRTKYFIEEIIRDWTIGNKKAKAILLRYFNPIGAHPSGKIGEDPIGIPNNLMPYLLQVAIGKLPALHIFGSDYSTLDGTGVRDYIHVVDLARGHLSAIDHFSKQPMGTTKIYNLGRGNGYSVLEMVRTLEKVTGKSIEIIRDPRRVGDVAEVYADPSKAHKELGWNTTLSLDAMIEDAWRWQSRNPGGTISPNRD